MIRLDTKMISKMGDLSFWLFHIQFNDVRSNDSSYFEWNRNHMRWVCFPWKNLHHFALRERERVFVWSSFICWQNLRVKIKLKIHNNACIGIIGLLFRWTGLMDLDQCYVHKIDFFCKVFFSFFFYFYRQHNSIIASYSLDPSVNTVGIIIHALSIVHILDTHTHIR